MKKVEIITFHKALSYGAGFQAYALQEYIKNLGYNVEIIDYIPFRFSVWYSIFHQPRTTRTLKKIIKFIPYIICKGTSYLIIEKFNKRYLELSEKKFKREKDFISYNWDGEIFITGSDQVWNLNFDSFENIRPYLLSFTKDTDIRIAYASSIGMENFNSVDNAEEIEFKKLLEKYKIISVREDSAVNLLDNIGIKAERLLDPTFLLDGEYWRNFACKIKEKSKYIFIYGLYRNKELYALANQIAKYAKLQIINMADSYDFCKNAKNRIIVSHKQLLGYIANAECVITDSFHGAALSLNMNIPLFVFPSARYNSRIQSLVKLMRIEDRYIVGNMNYERYRNFKMDYSTVNRILESERIKAKKYLLNSLE